MNRFCLLCLLARCVYLQPYNILLLSSLIFFVNNCLLSEPVLSLQLLSLASSLARVLFAAALSFRSPQFGRFDFGILVAVFFSFFSSSTALISVIVAVSDLVTE